MTDTANVLVSGRGKLRRFKAGFGAWLQALDYTSFDYTQDRIDLLEGKVAALTEEVREGVASRARNIAAR